MTGDICVMNPTVEHSELSLRRTLSGLAQNVRLREVIKRKFKLLLCSG